MQSWIENCQLLIYGAGVNRQQARGLWRSRLAGMDKNGSTNRQMTQSANKQVVNLHINKLVVDGIPREQVRNLGQDVQHGLHSLLAHGGSELFDQDTTVDSLNCSTLKSTGMGSLGHRLANSIYASLTKQNRS